MSSTPTFLLTERTREAVAALVDEVSLPHDVLPAAVRERMPVVLTDLLGVTAAGLRTPELRRLVAAWPLEPGGHPLPGLEVRTTAEAAVLLAATAACSQELDEGNKHAAGHPAAHVVFAALAATRLTSRPVSGGELLAGVAGGYEVAARFGRALRRDAAWHPHGHWGAPGAAFAAATLLGASREQVAGAVDAACGLMTVAPWASVLAGDQTRHLWMGQANLAGLSAAHLARAGLVVNRGGAASSLALLGELDPDLLTVGTPRGWLAAEGYLKQHAACSYTHAAVDLVLALRASGGWEPDDVAAVRVGIHSLAAPLLQRSPANRLAAMFSLPFTVATAAVSGAVTPATMDPASPAFAQAEAFSPRVEVELLSSLDAFLPGRRVCEVEVELRDGSTTALAQPDPIGDTAHFPLDDADLAAKLDALLERPGAGGALLDAVRGLADEPDVVPALDRLLLGLSRRGPAADGSATPAS